MNADQERVNSDDVEGKAVDVALAEFDALRAEILSHTNTQAALVGIGLAALGVVVGLVVKEDGDERLLLAIPLLAAMVNLLYAAETHRVNMIGTYIEHELWPYLKERIYGNREDTRLPSWEKTVSENRGKLTILVGAPALVLFPSVSAAALVIVDDVDVCLLKAGWALTVIALVVPPAIGFWGVKTRKDKGTARAGAGARPGGT